MALIQPTAFAACSAQHRSSLESHGYQVLKQLGLDGHIARNQRWKTYWLVTTPRSRNCFVKINYGYEDTATNLAVGEKEARLPAWFSTHFEHDPQVFFPDVVDYWEQDGHSYVVFTQQTFRQLSLFTIAIQPEIAVIAKRFLDGWAGVTKPPWWRSAMETHHFAGRSTNRLDPRDKRAFGFDLDDNIGVDDAGRLFFFDFEFIEWSSPGLQQAYWCCKLATSRRQLVNLITGRGFAGSLASRFDSGDKPYPGRQAARAYLASIRRTRTPTWYERSAVKVAQTVLTRRSRN